MVMGCIRLSELIYFSVQAIPDAASLSFSMAAPSIDEKIEKYLNFRAPFLDDRSTETRTS